MFTMTEQGRRGFDALVLKILAGVWFGCFVYAGLSFTIGSKGLLPYGRLVEEKERLAANFADIRRINHDLHIRNILFGSQESDPINPIPADRDTLLTEARNMGSGLPGDVVIHFNGVSTPEKRYADPGAPLFAFRLKGVPDYIIKIISLVSAISLLLCVTLPDILGFCRYLQENPEAIRDKKATLK
jgi:hypothetical protein